MTNWTLDLGCGTSKTDIGNVIGADIDMNSEADVILDASCQLPFKNNSFDKIICHDILEHMEDLVKVLEEIWRVGRPGAKVIIRTPHYSSYFAYNDPTHKQLLGYFSFDFFSDGEYENTMFAEADIISSGAEFSIVEKELMFPRLWRLAGVSKLANHHPARWEQLFAFIFRAENIRFTLTIKK